MNHGWQSESTDGPKSGWNVELFYLSIRPFVWLPAYLSTSKTASNFEAGVLCTF